MKTHEEKGRSLRVVLSAQACKTALTPSDLAISLASVLSSISLQQQVLLALLAFPPLAERHNLRTIFGAT